MLPFLKPKSHQPGMIIEERKPDQKSGSDLEEALHLAAKDILDAISMKDYRKLALAFKAAYDVLESQEHEEMAPEID